MIDISVFKSLLKKETYNKYKNIIFQIPSLEFEINNILNTIKDYYNTYPEKDMITVDELQLHFNNLYPAIKNPETYVQLISRFEKADINNVQLLIDSINRVSEAATANLILQECIELVNNPKTVGLSKIEEHLEFYKSLTQQSLKPEICDLTFDELIRIDSEEFGLNWKLDFLRKTVGSLKPGTLAHIFAYVETGKTSLGIFELVNFAQHLIEPDCVLYLSNEEPVVRTRLRAYCAFAQVDKYSAIASKDRIIKAWDKAIGNKLKMADNIEHIHEVEQYIDAYSPKLVMIDQGTKVNIPGEYNKVEKLQQLYNRYRQLAIKNNMVIITLGQADASCENKKHLKLGNMDNSKIGIPGELDIAIGIGSTDEEGFETRRYLSVCKNKLTGSHGHGQVTFYNTKCTYVD